MLTEIRLMRKSLKVLSKFIRTLSFAITRTTPMGGFTSQNRSNSKRQQVPPITEILEHLSREYEFTNSLAEEQITSRRIDMFVFFNYFFHDVILVFIGSPRSCRSCTSLFCSVTQVWLSRST